MYVHVYKKAMSGNIPSWAGFGRCHCTKSNSQLEVKT